MYGQIYIGYGDVAMGNSARPLNIKARRPRDIVELYHWVVVSSPRLRVHATSWLYRLVKEAITRARGEGDFRH